MNTIGERISHLIKELGITRIQFGETIGLTPSAVSKVCLGGTTPSTSTIKSICLTYNVNEDWLRTGEGEMFVQRSDDEELAHLMGSVMSDEKAAFRREMVRLILELPDEAINMIEEFARKRLDAYYKKQKEDDKKD